MLKINHIGAATTIENWPANTLDGLFDALGRWQLRPDLASNDRLEPHPLRAPFRGPCVKFGGCRYSVALGHNVYLNGDLIYPDHPQAVSYVGNFMRYSFAFRLETDEEDLIARLDEAIAENLRREWVA